MRTSNLLARLRRSWWQRAIVLFAVPAILICVLATLVLMSGGSNDSGQSPAMLTHAMDTAMGPGEDAAATSHQGPASADDCGGLCGPSDDMLGMLCMLVLLVTGVLLTLHLILIRSEGLRQLVTAHTVKAVALAPPLPPSLHILSISRT